METTTSTARPAAAVSTASATAIRLSYLEWGPVIAGAVGAAAISLVLLTFGTGIGLSAMSPWPGEGISLTLVAIITAIWVAVVQVFSFGAGGYIAGRMRGAWADATPAERQFRDGAHGFVVWALAVLVTAAAVTLTGMHAARTTTQAGATMAAGTAAGMTSRPDTNMLREPSEYAVDFLLRPGPNPPPAQAAGAPDQRESIGRVFIAGLREGNLSARDRTWLVQVVTTRTGMSQEDAERRVDEAFNEAKAVQTRLRDAADKARKATIVAAFLTAATLAVAAVAATAGAALGGRHRDERTGLRFFGRERFW